MSYEISVVVPVYNREAFLKETLDAIFNQTYQPTEIVVVDDGSTDRSWDILQSYGSRLKTLKIENSGAGNARKTAAEHASCPWLAFCDSDDIWLNNHLERRVNLLNKYPGTDYTFSDAIPFGEHALADKTYFSDAPKGWWASTGTEDNDHFLTIKDHIYRKFLPFNPVLPSTVVMSRTLYDLVGGIDSKYSRMPAEDADLTRRAVAQATHVVADMAATVKQRRHGQNMSAIEAENMIGKNNILKDHLSSGITPREDISFVLEEIDKTVIQAILASFYKKNFHLFPQLAKQVELKKLPFPILVKYAYLTVRHLFS